MNKWGLLLAITLAGVSSLFAQNKMQMVTYFPVPYVAYNDIEVTQFCEVGLLNQCNLSLGPGDPAQNPYALHVYKSAQSEVAGHKLNTGVISVKSGALNLNSNGVNNKITGNTLEAGSGNMQQNSEVSFEHKLNVVSTNNIPSRSVSSETNAQIKEIKMFPDRIVNNLPGCAEGITWQRARIGMSSSGVLDEVFLVCGTPVITQVCQGAKPSAERTCASGCGTQKRAIYCNINTGQWEGGPWTGACSNPPKTSRDCVEGCGTQTRSYSCNGTRWVPTEWVGSCWAPYGGGQNRDCSSGCGTETSTSTCSGPSWSGSCWSPSCDKNCGCSQCGSQYCVSSCDGGYCSGDCWATYGGGTQTRPCGDGGTQSRYCVSTCYGEDCPDWGPCEGEATPTPEPTYDCTGAKPATSQTCNVCGTQTRSVTCDNKTGKWVSGNWGSCDKTADQCNTPCPTSCPAGQKPSGAKYQEEGACCIPKTSCPTSCPSGSVRTDVQYQEDGECCRQSGYTSTTEMRYAIESGCSGAGLGSLRVCIGGVAWDKKYSTHELTRCENRTGATCSDVNWYWLFSGDSNYPQNATGAARCTGSTISLSSCADVGYDFDALCTQRANEGYLCVLSYYGRGCTQVGTKPCIRDGNYCRNLESDRYGGTLPAAHDVMVVKCVKK